MNKLKQLSVATALLFLAGCASEPGVTVHVPPAKSKIFGDVSSCESQLNMHVIHETDAAGERIYVTSKQTVVVAGGDRDSITTLEEAARDRALSLAVMETNGVAIEKHFTQNETVLDRNGSQSSYGDVQSCLTSKAVGVGVAQLRHCDTKTLPSRHMEMTCVVDVKVPKMKVERM
ncbi:hypothetical protein [Photobacterium sanguinicancri]|uniref:hypothetical protein n=1 Tax=Photobacterium sanguinicancri TaxID=875932 RepID=UPI00247FA818|nr:hypothetical protein [Photobacterium sanguinicancri]